MVSGVLARVGVVTNLFRGSHQPVVLFEERKGMRGGGGGMRRKRRHT